MDDDYYLEALVLDTKEEIDAFLEYDRRKPTAEDLQLIKESVALYEAMCKKQSKE